MLKALIELEHLSTIIHHILLFGITFRMLTVYFVSHLQITQGQPFQRLKSPRKVSQVYRGSDRNQSLGTGVYN